MIPLARHIHRLRILIISRLFIGTFLLFYAQFVYQVEQVVFYALVVSILILSFLYVGWLLYGKRLLLFASVQIACDLILESAIVYYTGGVDSLFAPVYVLSILSAGFLMSPVASFYVAGGSSLCFIAATSALYFGGLPGKLPLPDPTFRGGQDMMYVFYASYVRITVFFLVAWLTFYFSRMIKRLEEQMKSQERLVFLGEVVSSIAHEIRNPLASISGSIELLARQLRLALTEKQRKLMSAVVDESERIKHIFSGLLDYSKVEELMPEWVAVEPLLDQIVLLVRHQNGFNGHIEIDPRYHGKSLRMRVDPEQAKQALMNVVVNGLQAMPTGGRLVIDSAQAEDEVKISVLDTGCGMDKKTLRGLFTPFKTTKTGGTGLGMAQVQKVLSQHGGHINIHSKRGQGTHVELFFPAV